MCAAAASSRTASSRTVIYLADLFNALQRHVCQHVGLDASQEHVVVHLVHHFLVLSEKETTVI